MKFRILAGFVLSTSLTLSANPTGGTVTSGAATINPLAGKTLTIDRTSQDAIIDWSTFSIAYGETTKFVQPNSSSAVLNRVTGGGTSVIDGTLTANGQVFLINGNGILVSKTGKVDTAGFTASTLDIADSDFLSGNDHFNGTSTASVQNLGAISASSGNIYFIAQQVSNGGTLSAPNGTVGLAAGTDVLVAQKNADGSTVTVNPSSTASSIAGTGVANAGRTAAAAAELRAANGNIYALAINNTGSVRATGVSNKSGHIWLVSDTGAVVTRGTLQTSAAGTITTNGETVGASGTVNTGVGGKWTIDPPDLVITNTPGGSNISATTLSNELDMPDSTISIGAAGGQTDSGNLDVESPITWTSDSSLGLTATNNINLQAAITASKGTLAFGAANDVFANGAINVENFGLQSGLWNQIVGPGLAKLPTFTVTKNFSITTGATFSRFAGGNGSAGNPYQVSDVYGLQGIASGTPAFGMLQDDDYILKNAISATVTSNWTSSSLTGFTPIENFAGILNGNNESITGLAIAAPNLDQIGLFSVVSSIGVVENLKLTNAQVTGQKEVGLLAGENEGAIEGCNVSGTVTNASDLDAPVGFGGLAGASSGEVSNCTSSATVNIQTNPADGLVADVGGLIGNSNGTVLSSSSTGKVTASGPDGNSAAFSGVAGFVGTNSGTIANSANKATVSVTAEGGLEIGGLVGNNLGSVISSTNSGAVTLMQGGSAVGGLIGGDSGTGGVTSCSNTGVITVQAEPGQTAANIAGLIGTVSGADVIEACTNSGAVKFGGLGAELENVAGLVGSITGSASISASSNSGAVSEIGTAGCGEIAGLVGLNETGELADVSNNGMIAVGGPCDSVGGLVGVNEEDINYGTNSGAIHLTGTAGSGVGGVAGTDDNAFLSFCTNTGAISITGKNAPLTEAGGIVGLDNSGQLMDCSSTSAISASGGSSKVGGLIGSANSSTDVLDSSAGGSITITDTSSTTGPQLIGGLVGNSGATITGSSSSVKITIADTSTQSTDTVMSIGGIAGASSGTITDCSNSGAISIANHQSEQVGGVAGFTTAPILSSSNSGALTLTASSSFPGQYIGGVVGLDEFDTMGALALKNVSNSGAITVGVAAGVGGVGGVTEGNVQSASNSGAIKGGADGLSVGGVFGEAEGNLNTINNTGAITLGTTCATIGGLVGNNAGMITGGFNTGAVSVGSGREIGGVAGVNTSLGSMSEVYNLGSVTSGGSGNVAVGGLIGANTSAISTAVAQAYSTGKVSATGTAIGGLVGDNESSNASVVNSYWNQQTSGQMTSAGGTAVATTTAMQTEGTYVGFDFLNSWSINPGGTPYLLEFQTPQP